jgi:hypothetical protein
MGCHHAYTGEYADQKESADGVYDYRAVVDGVPVKGTFAIRGDFFTLNIENGTCQRDAPWHCSAVNHDIIFTISRERPLRGSTWRSTRTEMRQRQICVRFATRKDGTEVCVEYGPELFEAVVPIGGQLTVQTREPR